MTRTIRVSLLLLFAAVSLSAQGPMTKRASAEAVRPTRAEPEAPSKAEPGPVAEAATVRLIRFSGVLRPEASGLGQPACGRQAACTGTVGVTFALYKEQSGGAPLWLETQNVELGTDGRYTVLLGATHNEGLPLEIFTSEEARWLEVTVQGNPEGSGEQARILLVSVPYALKAADAERLGGKPAEAFLLAETSGEEASKDGGRERKLSKGGDGTLAQVVSGTVGQIAKFTATDTVQDSIITETGGGDIGVGTTTPMGKLHVQKTGALTKLVVGNPSPVANNAADGFIQIFGENSGVVKSVFIQNIGDSLQLNGASTGVNIQLLGANETSILNGTSLGVYDATNAKRLYVRHDGTRVLFSTFGTNAGGMAFRPVANLTNAFQFQVAGGATTVLNIDTTNQRVGIGTTSPQGKLHVNPGDLRLGVGAQGNLVDASADPQIYTTQVMFEGNMNQLGHLVIQPGTSLPRDILFATSSDGLNTEERMRIRAGGGVEVGGTLTAGGFQTSGDLSSVGSAFIDGSASVDGNAFLATAFGNVGIGTAIPSAKLEVVGDLKVSQGAKLATISGDVGIGTNSPTSKLHVVGNDSDQIVLVTQDAAGIANPSVLNLPPIAVLGDATATSLTVVGVFGRSVSPEGIGVIGIHTAATGEEAGVVGITLSTTGIGVEGEADSATGATTGVRGVVQSTSGTGVFGEAEAETGVTTGVMGQVNSTTGGAAGVRGVATGLSGATRGVVGSTESLTNLATGVLGDALGNAGEVFGVRGRTASADGAGGQFQNLGGGPSLVTWDAANAETFRIEGDGGIQQVAPNASVLIRLFGQGGLDQFHVLNSGETVIQGPLFADNIVANGTLTVSSNAGISGNLSVSGSLSKGSGSFKIDHPLDSENKYLYHSFVESPEMKNVYDGVVVLDEHGEAVVELPEYFEALNSDYRYQLTCVGGFAPVYIAGEMRENRFQIAGGKPGMKVSWQVTGIRQDAYARAHRIQVEEEKPVAERGYYLHPDAFGLPLSKGVGWARRGESQPAPGANTAAGHSGGHN